MISVTCFASDMPELHSISSAPTTATKFVVVSTFFEKSRSFVETMRPQHNMSVESGQNSQTLVSISTHPSVEESESW